MWGFISTCHPCPNLHGLEEPQLTWETGKGNNGSFRITWPGQPPASSIFPLIKTGFSTAGGVENRLWDLLGNRIFWRPYLQRPCRGKGPLVAQTVKHLSINVGDLGSIPGSVRFPGEGKSNPLQYSCLENPMDGGAWCRLLSMGLQRVRHNWVISLHFTCRGKMWLAAKNRVYGS